MERRLLSKTAYRDRLDPIQKDDDKDCLLPFLQDVENGLNVSL